MTVRIIGLDLSLRSTGLAILEGTTRDVSRILTGDRRGYPRLDYLREEIAKAVKGCGLIVVEGLSMHSKGRSVTDMGGLWWLITYDLWYRRYPLAVVPPASLKVYATGKGIASKDQVFAAAIRRYPMVAFDGNDQADALILAAMGADQMGCPLAEVPKAQRKALAKVDWPALAPELL